jgi:hypothetical protein
MPTMAPIEREVLVEVVDEDVDPPVAVEEVPGLVGVELGNGGYILNAGEMLTLLELESSRILNWYCWVVGISAGMRTVALPLAGSMAIVWESRSAID